MSSLHGFRNKHNGNTDKALRGFNPAAPFCSEPKVGNGMPGPLAQPSLCNYSGEPGRLRSA
ncbi:hypothetical protein J43TS9_41960 [Paenibacillus cineris]|nr:hypothetical protein J43TS9_41960 [Paenibacillus cineris]